MENLTKSVQKLQDKIKEKNKAVEELENKNNKLGKQAFSIEDQNNHERQQILKAEIYKLNSELFSLEGEFNAMKQQRNVDKLAKTYEQVNSIIGNFLQSSPKFDTMKKAQAEMNSKLQIMEKEYLMKSQSHKSALFEKSNIQSQVMKNGY